MTNKDLYTDAEMVYIDDKLTEWECSADQADFVTWMLKGNDPLDVFRHLAEEGE